MPRFRSGTVTEVLSQRSGIQRVRVMMDDGVAARAYALTDQIGTCAVGDEIVCNTTAVDLGLGTGGWHVVHWNLARRELQQPGPDHIMKLRYTSLQSDVGTSELVHPEIPATLDGVPVVVCQVHSQVGVVVATIAALRPGTRVAYVMTDGASLPLALSDLVATLRERGALSATVTCGHAFGGDLEAVTVASGVTLARWVSDADIIIVGMGPGVVGTGTRLGTTAIEAATLLDTVAALEGTAIMCVRASSGDLRERHQGISHHSITALELALSRALVAATSVVPAVDETLAESIEVTQPDIAAILDAAGLRITTMGRDVNADRMFFDAASASAALAVHLLQPSAP